MSLNNIFSTGRRSLRAMEGALQTTGQNIAGAHVDGYSRQRVTLRADNIPSAGVTMRTAPGTFTGAGVQIAQYERLRDGLLDAAARTARGGLGAAEEDLRAASLLEGLFADAPGGLGQGVRDLFNAFADAADAPADRGLRGVVLGRVDALSEAFKRHDAELVRQADDTRTALGEGVTRFNALTAEVAALNDRIYTARAAGVPDFGAEDDRGRALDALADLAPLRVRMEADGTATVTVQGMAVVQGKETLRLEADGPPQADGVRFAGTSVQFEAGAEGNGRLGGWLRTLGQTLPRARASLDGLAGRLVQTVNDAHAAGFGLDGGTGRPLFDPAGTTAGTMKRDGGMDNPGKLALAGAPDAPGNAQVALALASVREGFQTEVAALATDAGRLVGRARGAAAGNEALVSYTQALSAAVSGVSIDEEMTRMLAYQQAYAASARVISTAQTMFDTLLAM